MDFRRHAGWGGVVGPVGFVAAWVSAGIRAPHYSPVNDAISQLAAVDAPTRWLMTSGFFCFGLAVPVFALALRRAVGGPAWVAAMVAGLATLGVALFPLHVSSAVSLMHGVCASIGYVALALVPLFAAPALAARGQRNAATASRVVAAVAAVCLALTTLVTVNGLFQRAGLTVVDVWLVVAALTGLRAQGAPAATGQNLAR